MTVVPATSARGAVIGSGSGEAPFATVALEDPLAVHPVGVVYDAHRLSPAASAFLSILPTADQPA